MELPRLFLFRFGRRVKALLWASLSALSLLSPVTSQAVDLADQPMLTTVNVPGNLILALSVEWPTATTPAYESTTPYKTSSTYLGYFDPEKCYVYEAVNTGTKDSPDYSTSYFSPKSVTSNHSCEGKRWSGNYLNWAAMQTLDAFRWVMTGGYRSTDTKDTTILTKTYAAQDNAKVIPLKTISGESLVSGATPFGWDAATTRLRALGTAMYITKSGNIDDKGVVPVDYTHPEKPSDTTVYRVYINVKVCDARVGLESNCTSYPSKYAKPEGLMQKYASKLRYSAFGYYNHNGSEKFQRDGGVMRAGMKFIGPKATVPGKPAITNVATEWDAETGVMLTNPDSADATRTEQDAKDANYTVSIPNSGVMNYLNKFGYSAKSYKSHDPVSELYYAALRYFKKQGNLSQYTDLSGAGSKERASAWLDGFPAITKWDDPIAYTCQKNFVLGIGDVNAHRDGNLPGSTLRSRSTLDSINPAVDDASVDVAAATNMVGQLEGISQLGDRFVDFGTGSCLSESNDWNKWSRCNTNYLAGLAYDAHTKDIRPDLDGSQTVNSYFMDVLEEQIYASKNQYWLAAKYGGFNVPTGFSPYAASNGTSTIAEKDWYTSSDTIAINKNKADKRPDNYFPGNRPELMQSGLTAAFAKIASETESATGTALSTVSPNVSSTGTASYAASYDPITWTGELVGYEITYDKEGNPTSTEKWNARTLLSASTTTSGNRKIVTCCTKDGKALPFTYGAMKDASLISRTYLASFGKVPGVSAEAQSIKNYIDYLRGDREQEVANGGAYRTRTYRLGDIVNSKPNAVGKPDFPYFDVYNPGYSAFKAAHAQRSTVVYVGANDGMLHAFDGSIDTTDSGKELFAYVPSFVYGDKDTAATSGLAALGNSSYSHRYYVDATPAHFDLDFSKTDGAADKKTPDWRTLLIGGLGKGGKGYFAIDVTDPSKWTDQSAVAGKVLWEFTDERMGYSYGRPSVVKTAKYGWVVLFTSGYNNSDGKGYFFIVNPRNGALLEAVEAEGGSIAHPLNIGEHTAYVSNYNDMTADAVYAGDLAGNVWRLDLTGTTTYDAPKLIATLANDDGVAQPVSTRPLVEVEPNSKKRYVFLGTGKLLADSDLATGDQQSFYAIVDGTGMHGDFYSSSTLPSGVGFPVTRSQLEENKDLLAGIGSAPTSSMGWYFDLPVENGLAQRVNVTPTANQGVVAFVANLPNGQVCSPGGVGTLYATSFADGKTVLKGKDDKAVAWLSPTGGVLTDIAIQRVDDSLRLIVGGNDPDGKPAIAKAPANLTTASGLKQMNWRGVTASK